MKLLKLKLADLGPNPSQPKGRTNVADLVPLLEKYGQLDPLTIMDADTGSDVKYYIIDGHRRKIGLLKLGAEEAWCIHLDREMAQRHMNAVEAMSLVNTSKRFTTKNHIELYLKGGILPATLAQQLLRLTTTYGNGFIKWMQDRGLSPRTCTNYLDVALMIDLGARKDFYSFLEWAVRFHQSTELIYLQKQRFNQKVDITNLLAKLKDCYRKDKRFELELQ